ncbi:hypothetical protein [Paenibacillus beijingensis]|uniref:Uncharacterized protein n=1 Tax=Paenibacillus beijingensis TaxID=1126833 RepID=A0A0D5NNV1_9BACL|nr:hypothetical protein [Paenibacillus beijingensis]AJY76593.1 hypothetical protein VN24_20990 [Paenibacillus beijingensis]
MALQPWHYVVLIGAVALVWALAMPKAKKGDNKEAQTLHNMETALEVFMENMEADNRNLTEKVLKTQREFMLLAQQREERIAELERKCAALEVALEHRGPLSGPASSMAVSEGAEEWRAAESNDATDFEADARNNASEPPAEITIRSRYKELLELLEQGQSVEQTARKLNMNKGEVELIRQLARREETAYG